MNRGEDRGCQVFARWAEKVSGSSGGKNSGRFKNHSSSPEGTVDLFFIGEDVIDPDAEYVGDAIGEL